jgi:hypothetical protein
MANRASPISQVNAKRLFTAAKAAGYGRARLVLHTDGRIEVIAESDGSVTSETAYDAWKRPNGSN